MSSTTDVPPVIQDKISNIADSFGFKEEITVYREAGITGAETAVIAVTFILTNFVGTILKEAGKDLWQKIKNLKDTAKKEKESTLEINLKIPIKGTTRDVCLFASTEEWQELSDLLEFIEESIEKKNAVENEQKTLPAAVFRYSSGGGWQQL